MSTYGHDVARKRYRADQCEACKATPSERRIERHHVDGNPYNNVPSNIRVLCTRCHMTEDGRLQAVTARASRLQALGAKARTKWAGVACAVPACDRPAKYRGLCNSHYYRARNHGWNPGDSPVRAYGGAK